MKKKTIILVIIAIIIGIVIFLISSGYGIKLYNYFNYNEVLDYGKSLTIYEILGNDINITEYPELGEYTYKKAKVKSIGSTVHKNITIDNNNIIFIGNKNLIKINNTLYVYGNKVY